MRRIMADVYTFSRTVVGAVPGGSGAGDTACGGTAGGAGHGSCRPLPAHLSAGRARNGLRRRAAGPALPHRVPRARGEP